MNLQRISTGICIIFLFLFVKTEISSAIELNIPHHYPPSYGLSIGYNLIKLKGSKQALEYIEPDDTFAISGNVEAYPLPHRFHLETTAFSDDEYYLDTGYAYKDILLSRLIMVGMVHNLEHYDYELTAPSSARKYEDRNPADEYEHDTSKTDFTARLKMPDYPFHLFTRYYSFHNEGNYQQRFLLGYFTDMTKVSESRNVDKKTEEIVFGTNGHFGPIEIEYSHSEKKFSLKGDKVLRDLYPNYTTRPSDIYPHNILPELKSSSDFVKIHSSYTGRIVASGTFGSTRSYNSYSHTKRETISTRGEFTYIPMHELAFFLRLHYSDTDEKTPESILLRGDTNLIYYQVRPAPDRKKRMISFNVRVRPLKRITLVGGYTFTDIDRSDSDEWRLIDRDTSVQALSLKLYGRPVKGLNIRAQYKYIDGNNPAYNIQPDRAHELRLYSSYSPSPWVTATVSYYLKKYMNDNLRYFDYGEDIEVTDGERRMTVQNLLALLTLIPSKKTTVTMGVGVYRNRIKQTLVYSTFLGDGSYLAGPPITEDRVPYTDESIQYNISITQRVNDRLQFAGDVVYTLSRGKYRTSYPLTDSVGTFSDLNVKEIGISFNTTYQIYNGFSLETKLSYNEYKDRIESDNTGRAYRAVVLLGKRL